MNYFIGVIIISNCTLILILDKLQFHENSSKHPKKITLLFFIKNIFLNPGWPSYCIRRYLNTQRCTWPPENLIFQVVTEMLPTESKSQRQIGPYIIALLQNYSFLCCSSRHWKKAAAFLGPVGGNTSLDQQSEVFHIKMRWLLIISDVRGTI